MGDSLEAVGVAAEAAGGRVAPILDDAVKEDVMSSHFLSHRGVVVAMLSIVWPAMALAQAIRPAIGQQAQPLPCCAITAINARAGQVTARVNASGQVFTFTASASVVNSLKLGQGVYANFTSKQVSLDGRSACCQIVSITPAAAAPASSAAGSPAAARPQAAVPEAATVPAAESASKVEASSTVASASAHTASPQAAAKEALDRSDIAGSRIAEQVLNPCMGLSRPTAERPEPGKTPTNLKIGEANSAPTLGSFGESICAGTPYRRTFAMPTPTLRFDQREVTASVNGQTVKGTILHLRGLDGIQQALAQGLIPKTVGDILSMHVRALPAGQSDHYLVNPKLALAWSKTHPEPPLATGQATDNHEGCNKWTWHCAGEVVQHAEGQVEQLRAQAQQDWEHMAGQAAQMYGETAACFDESYKTLAKVPVAFNEPFQINFPFSESKSMGSLSGNIIGKVGMGFPVQTSMMTDVSVFYVECLPFMIRPRGVDADGSITTGTTFNAQVAVTAKFQKDFPVYSTQPPIPIQVLPIVVAGVPIAEVDMSAYIAADVALNVSATAEASYQFEHTHTINLQFSCDGGGCTSHQTQGPTQTTTSKSAEIKGQAVITPAVYTALQFDFDFDALSVRAGPKPALVAQVNGCAYAGETTVSGGPSVTQHSQCLVADLDWKTDFVSEVLIAQKSVASHTNALIGQRHILFDDFLPGGSTALIASVTEVPNSAPGKPVYFNVQMPQCYPYTDQVQYQIAWSGGGSGIPDPSSACIWNDASGAGTCFGNPSKELEIGFQWPTGNHSLTVTLVHDKHPRDFKVALNPVTVEVRPDGVRSPAAKAVATADLAAVKNALAKNATTCSGHGQATSNGACVCDANYSGQNCNSCAANFYGDTCQYCSAAATCNGHGSCTNNGACACDAGYSGANCSTQN